jgi:hypothetical protein
MPSMAVRSTPDIWYKSVRASKLGALALGVVLGSSQDPSFLRKSG